MQSDLQAAAAQSGVALQQQQQSQANYQQAFQTAGDIYGNYQTQQNVPPPSTGG